MEWGMATTTPKLFIVYCSIAGFISAWAISGLLVLMSLGTNKRKSKLQMISFIAYKITDNNT
ncbi:MAG TPA: hypothetical protein VE076_01830 [Nitrososphaeraceae archaeon]|nr:hypothetical protein [Nitrososphaeraceae archaeon]